MLQIHNMPFIALHRAFLKGEDQSIVSMVCYQCWKRSFGIIKWMHSDTVNFNMVPVIVIQCRGGSGGFGDTSAVVDWYTRDKSIPPALQLKGWVIQWPWTRDAISIKGKNLIWTSICQVQYPWKPDPHHRTTGWYNCPVVEEDSKHWLCYVLKTLLLCIHCNFRTFKVSIICPWWQILKKNGVCFVVFFQILCPWLPLASVWKKSVDNWLWCSQDGLELRLVSTSC